MKLLSWIAQGLLTLWGWETVGYPPENTPKFVFTAAPHTALRDGFLMVIYALSRGFFINFLVKDGVDVFIIGRIVRWLGGIPVDRSSRNNIVSQMITNFNEADNLILGVAPEGTRKYREKIKTGFYHIAYGANVPIVFGFLDFKTKRVGIGGQMQPTGDIEVDMVQVREFYKGMEGKYPELFNREMKL